jgi:hypothetical protein
MDAKMKKTLFFIAVMFAGLAHAEVFKCPKPGGTLTFQQIPCSIHGDGEKINIKTVDPDDKSTTESVERMKALSEKINDDKRKQDEGKYDKKTFEKVPLEQQIEREEHARYCYDLKRYIYKILEKEDRGIRHVTSVFIHDESEAKIKEYEKNCGPFEN